MTHDELLLACLDEFKGTPEEFGALLHDATKTVVGWTREMRKRECEEKTTARCAIRRLLHGAELLRAEG